MAQNDHKIRLKLKSRREENCENIDLISNTEVKTHGQCEID